MPNTQRQRADKRVSSDEARRGPWGICKVMKTPDLCDYEATVLLLVFSSNLLAQPIPD